MEGKTVSAIDGTNDNVEAAVLQRYGNAAQEVEACLCLPVSYDQALLNVIPDEIIERDYGCGDPTRHVCRGETVLDLGSGSGKACYIIAQIVGGSGVIGSVPPVLLTATSLQQHADRAPCGTQLESAEHKLPAAQSPRLELLY